MSVQATEQTVQQTESASYAEKKKALLESAFQALYEGFVREKTGIQISVKASVELRQNVEVNSP